MAILYIRNELGEFEAIPAIEGKQGPRGEQGPPGKDGENGTNGKDGKTPVKGVDYYTDNEKEEMIQDVIQRLPIYAGEVE